MKRIIITVATLTLLTGSTRAATVLLTEADLVGSRSTTGGVVAFDGWSEEQGGFQVSWNIAFNGTDWEYSYRMTDNMIGSSSVHPGISHWLLEVSPIITQADIDALIYDTTVEDGPRTWLADPLSPNNSNPGENNGNPNLPANLYGIKLEADESQIIWEFSSPQAPEWGDFYVKDGRHGGIVAVGWSSGFGIDPTSETLDFTPWVPIPGREADITPVMIISEPSAATFWVLGLIGMGVLRRVWRDRQFRAI